MNQQRKEEKRDEQGYRSVPRPAEKRAGTGPRQLRDPEEKEEENRDRNGNVEQPAESDPDTPGNAKDLAAFGDHANTGRSPSDAT